MKKIDAHLHFRPGDSYFCQIAPAAGHENTVECLQSAFAERDFDLGIVMGNHSLRLSDHEYPDFLRYCVGIDKYALESPERNRSADLVEQHLQRENCAGIKIYAGYCRYELVSPVYAPFYELAERYGKPVAVHMGVTASANALLKYSHPLLMDEAAVMFPNVQFVMCHFGNPFLAEAAVVMEKNENVSADLSGILVGRVNLAKYLCEQPGYVELLKTWIAYVEDYDRFMFGTDWPLVNLSEYAIFIETLIPEKHVEKVFFDNANRIYQLGL